MSDVGESSEGSDLSGQSIAFFKDSQELIDQTGVSELSEYSQVTPLTDRKSGYSVQRSYPVDIAYFPPRTKDNKDDVVALIHVVYNHPDEMGPSEVSGRIPITVRISPHSRYIQNHADYDFADAECPTKESIELSKRTPQPISLDYIDVFYYDHQARGFVDKKGDSISGKQILDRVFADHCDTTHWIKGVGLRIRLRSRSYRITLLSFTAEFLLFLLRRFFGRTVENRDSISSFYNGYKDADFKRLSTDSVDVFGYRASRSVVVIFCGVAALVYGIKYYFSIKTPYLSAIFSQSFLSVVHAVILLWFLDVMIPILLFRLANKAIKLRAKLMRVNFYRRG